MEPNDQNRKPALRRLWMPVALVGLLALATPGAALLSASTTADASAAADVPDLAYAEGQVHSDIEADFTPPDVPMPPAPADAAADVEGNVEGTAYAYAEGTEAQARQTVDAAYDATYDVAGQARQVCDLVGPVHAEALGSLSSPVASADADALADAPDLAPVCHDVLDQAQGTVGEVKGTIDGGVDGLDAETSLEGEASLEGPGLFGRLWMQFKGFF